MQVETSDGFLLGIQHIAYGSNHATNNSTASRPPVFLQHGLLQVCSRDSISVDSYCNYLNLHFWMILYTCNWWSLVVMIVVVCGAILVRIDDRSRSKCLQVQPVTCWHLSVFFRELKVYSMDSFATIGDLPKSPELGPVISQTQTAHL